MISSLKIIRWNKLLIALAAIVASGYAQTIDPIELVLEINPEIKAAELSYQSALEKHNLSTTSSSVCSSDTIKFSENEIL